MQPHPSPRGLRDQLKSESINLDSKTRWTNYRGPVSWAREEVIRQRLGVGTGAQPEIKLVLATSDTLRPGRLQRRDAGLVVGRAEVLDVAGSAPVGPHDLHSGRPGGGLHRANVGHPGSL